MSKERCALCNGEPVLRTSEKILYGTDSISSTAYFTKTEIRHRVECHDCHKKSPPFKSEEEAWEAWNFAQKVMGVVYSKKELKDLLNK